MTSEVNLSTGGTILGASPPGQPHHSSILRSPFLNAETFLTPGVRYGRNSRHSIWPRGRPCQAPPSTATGVRAPLQFSLTVYCVPFLLGPSVGLPQRAAEKKVKKGVPQKEGDRPGALGIAAQKVGP